MLEQQVTKDGTPIWIQGTGPSLVLVHGVLMDHRMWSQQVVQLTNHFQVVTYDMLGHGDAPDPPGERSLADFVAQLENVIESCGQQPLVLVGFSMGAMVSQAFAIRHPDRLRGLVLLNSVYNRNPTERISVRNRLRNLETNGIDDVIEAARERWQTSKERVRFAETISDMMDLMRHGSLSAKTKAYRVFATGDNEIAGKLRKVDCPTLIMTGDGDLGSPPHMSAQMAAEVPKSTLIIMPGQRHLMPGIASTAVNDTIVEFEKTLS